MGDLYKESLKSGKHAVELEGRWLTCESATVVDNDDPDKLGRVKVLIPSLDEANIYDDWVTPLGFHCLGDGFGMLMIPPIGTEVMISGGLGQKYNLFYHASVYNEETTTPAELGVDTAGVKAPKNLSYIATLLLLLKGQNVQLTAEQLFKAEAENIELLAGQKITAGANEIELTAQGDMLINGGNVVVNSDGSINISGQSVSISAPSVSIGGTSVTINPSASLKLFARTVNKIGPAI